MQESVLLTFPASSHAREALRGRLSRERAEQTIARSPSQGSSQCLPSRPENTNDQWMWRALVVFALLLV